MTNPNAPLRIDIAGPVGAGKTTLTKQLRRALASRGSMPVITNAIYTQQDADCLVRAQVMSADPIHGVETGGCPHTAIREDASINLAATFSPALVDLSICLIETAAGQDIRRKKGPCVAGSALLGSTKPTLPPMWASLWRCLKKTQNPQVRRGRL